MTEVANATRGRARILIVDQSTIMRRALMKILDDEYELVEATTADDAWAQLQDGEVSAVLMGLNLTDLKDYGLLERIRDARVTAIRHTPVAVVAEESDEERERAHSFGASAFVPKPFDSEQLKSLTRSLVESAGRPQDAESLERDERESTMVDPLTALPNRSYFFYRGPKELSFAQRHGKDLAVILIQMDNLDSLVEEHGRPVVKQLLRKLSKYVKAAVRTEDTVARVGARRFAVIAPTTNEFGAKEVADRVLAKVRTTVFNYSNKKISFTVSMGLAAPRVHSMENFDQIVDLCAQRLDMAVWSGGDRLVFGNQQPAPSEDAEQDSDADLGADLDLAEDTGVYTMIQPAIGAELSGGGDSDRPDPIFDPGDPGDPGATGERKAAAPALEVAMWLLESGQSEKLRPHYQLLLKEILPLLEHANSAMDLEIDSALKKLRDRLK